MSLKSLINGQKIKIDNHKSGENVSKDISKVHIHKTFVSNHNRRGKYIKISLDGRKIDFDKRFSADEQGALTSEISRVLEKDKQKLRKFAELVGDALVRWSSGDISLDDAQQYAKNIAGLFSLKPEIEEEFIWKVKEELVRYRSIHEDESGKKYSIDQNKKAISIVPAIQKHHKRL